MNLRDLFLALLVVLVWGANFTVIRIGLDGVPPLLLAALRFVFALFPAIFFIKPPRIPFFHWFSYGLFVGFGQFGCLFFAMHLGMPAGVASVVLQAQAFFTLLFAVVLLRERVAVRQVLGLLVAGFGLYVVGGGSGGGDAIPVAALLLTLAASSFWGMSNIVVRKAGVAATASGVKLDILSLVVWSSLVPPLPLFLCSLFLDGPQRVAETLTHLTPTSLLAVAYLAFGATLFGYGAWSRLLSRYPANHVAPLSLLVPVAGLITANLVLGEVLSARQWLGCGLVVVGLLLATLHLPTRSLLTPVKKTAMK